MNKIKIIKNCVSEQYVNFVEKELDSFSLPWLYNSNVANNQYKNVQPGFSNSPYAENKVLNTSYFFLYPLLLNVANTNNFFVERLLRIRIGAHLNRKTTEHDNVHIDNEEPHIVGLYYPHDTDGDTVFFDDIYGSNEILRIKPERGTMVFFDGQIPHASSSPTISGIRMTVNYNFIGKWPNEF